MIANLLQQFLNQRLFDIGEDDDQLKKLEKTAGELSKVLLSKRADLILFTLVALDPEIPADDPRIEQTMAGLTKNWNLVRGRFADTPITVLRAIIAEALRRAARSDATAASIIWYTAASYAQRATLGVENEIWRNFLEEVGSIAEKKAAEVWEGGSGTTEINFPPLSVPRIRLSATTVSQELLENYFIAAAGPGGGDSGEIERNGNYPSASYPNPAWSQPFGEISSTGVATVVNQALARIPAALKGAEEFQEALTAYMNEVGSVIRRALAPAAATALRTRLLWWKEARFSPSLRRDYGGLNPLVRPLVMAADFHGQVPHYCPLSVDFFLADAVRQVAFAADRMQPEEGHTVEEYVGALAEAEVDLAGLLPKGKEQPGRIPLLEFVRRAMAGGQVLAGIRELLGITEADRIPPSEFAMWIFRDLQAQRLASQK